MENNQDHSSNEEKVSLEKIINELPKEEKDKFVAAIYAYEKKSWSGPLPSPEDFERYEKVLPGSMDRVLTVMEKQAAHRMEEEKKELDARLRQTARGQIIGASVVALFGTFSFVLGMYNHDSVATGLGVATAISLAVIFVLRQVPAWWSDKNMKI